MDDARALAHPEQSPSAVPQRRPISAVDLMPAEPARDATSALGGNRTFAGQRYEAAFWATNTHIRESAVPKAARD